MACGPLEANKVEQFHIAGPCVNAEQIRRRPHFYVRHRNVVDSGIDCASTTSEPYLVRTRDYHVPAFPSSLGEFTEATTRDVGTWNATATLQRFLRKRERDLMNDSAGACWRALERKGAACNSCCSAFALHICGSCYLLLCDPCLHTGLCECFTSDSASRPRPRLLTPRLSISTTAPVASTPHWIMEGPPGDWSLPYLRNLQNYDVYVNAMEVIMSGTDVDLASGCGICSAGIGLLPTPVGSECDNGICARACLPTPRVPPPTLAETTANDESGGIVHTTPICKSSHSSLARPPGAWKFPTHGCAATYVASVCAGHRPLVGTASAWVAVSSGHETHNQVVGPPICQDKTDEYPTEVGIQVIEV